MGRIVNMIAVLVTLLGIGILASKISLNKKMSNHPLVGLVVFGFLSVAVGFYWKGVWQMWPIHFLLFVLMLEYGYLVIKKSKKIQVAVKLNRKLAMVCVYFSLCGMLLFPVVTKVKAYSLKEPVGSWKMVVKSEDREERMGSVEGAKRRFVIQLYYPIQKKAGADKKWLDSESAIRGLALSYGLPEVLMGHLKATESQARLSRNIKVSDAGYQVVVISHGLKGSAELYTRLSESLAAKGYVVAVVNHAYSSFATVFDKEDYVYGVQASATQMDLLERKIYLEEQMTQIHKEDLNEVFKVLEQINSGNVDNRFKSMLNLEEITLVGHQIGGGAAISLLNEAPSVKVGVLLNPVVEQVPRQYILKGSEKPIVALLTRDYMDSNNAPYLKRYLEQCRDVKLVYAQKGMDIDMNDLGQVTYLFRLKGISDGSDASSKLIKAQVRLVDFAIQKYCQGQIFENSSEDRYLAGLGIMALKPDEINDEQQ